MKRAALLITLLLALGISCEAEKYALIVAIAHFASPDLHTLHSTNDVPFVRTALEKQGFLPANIQVLTDTQATKANVWRAMNTLTDRCKPGDIVWIHFTTHGQLIEDFDGYAPDGWAKTLVMYDSPKKYIPGYKGERHLKDTDIRAFSEKIRSKLGPHGELAIIADACHSGALMRGIALSKGVEEPLAQPGYDPLRRQNNAGIEGFYTTLVESAADEAVRAPYVFISACRSAEVCLETIEKTTGQHVGPLSLALSHALVSAVPGSTFRELFSKILFEMNSTVPNQIPVATGNGLDKVILGGDIKPVVYAYPVRSLRGQDTVEIAAGTFAGVYERTEVAIYRADDPQHSQAYRKGTVISAAPFTSIVVLDKSSNVMSKDQMRTLSAVVTRKSFGDMSVRLYIDNAADPKEQQWLKAALSQYQYVKLSETKQNADLVIQTSGHRLVKLLYAMDGMLLRDVDVDFDRDDHTQLTAALRRFMQGRAIKKLQLDNPLIYVDYKISAVGTDTGNEPGGVVTAHAGKDKIVVSVTNSGSKTVYINILDIEPVGRVNPVFPQREMDESQYKIYPTKTLTKAFDVAPPYGMESLKIILSEEDINLGVIAASEGTRGIIHSDNPLEMMFKDAYSATNTRGINNSYDKIDNATTIDLNFKIEP